MAKKTLTFDQVAALAESVGLPGKAFAEIAKGESGFQPGAIGHDPGGTKGYGLWQITTKYNDDIIQKFGGRKAMLNPVQNAKAAKAIYDRQGIKAWYGTRYLTDPKAHYNGPGKPPRSTRTVTRAPTADDARKQIVLSLLGYGNLAGGYGGGSDLTSSLLSAASQKQAAPKARQAQPKQYGGGNASIMELAELAKNKFGLSVRELAPYDKVDPVHTKGSFHYSNRAFDASGDPKQMAAFNRYVAKRYGKRLKEMFYDPGISIDNGRRTGSIGGHGSHVHVAI